MKLKRKRKYKLKRRCVECGIGIRRRRGTTSNYKGDLCYLCRDIRTVLNKKKYEKKRQNNTGGPKTILERAISRVILNQGLTIEIKRAINSRFYPKNYLKEIRGHVEALARREARRATYGILLTLGAKTFFSEKKGKIGLRSKMIGEIGESLDRLK